MALIDKNYLNTEGKTTISNSSGDIAITATATANEIKFKCLQKAGVDFKF